MKRSAAAAVAGHQWAGGYEPRPMICEGHGVSPAWAAPSWNPFQTPPARGQCSASCRSVCAVLTFSLPAVLIWLMAKKSERDSTRRGPGYCSPPSCWRWSWRSSAPLFRPGPGRSPGLSPWPLRNAGPGWRSSGWWVWRRPDHAGGRPVELPEELISMAQRSTTDLSLVLLGLIAWVVAVALAVVLPTTEADAVAVLGKIAVRSPTSPPPGRPAGSPSPGRSASLCGLCCSRVRRHPGPDGPASAPGAAP